ncbi:uncharacterized protein N7529_009421 [Penicillium soppii]|uniref:uncharacterized protein n=1 Tax=Penicillium soppii TaxID=69789 RepID=UPI0025467A37|nr:uncharacterized protein N7529_009421 [Penicillium soppii]KAJ5855477.1 hypothetical protein N7529_009421 [Penicillium soppii]
MLSPHESRAIPNQRLRIFFGIDNAFTRNESSHVAPFVEMAKDLINVPAKRWEELSMFARTTATNWTINGFPDDKKNATQTDKNRINITSMVQILTMRCVLSIIFPDLDQAKVHDLSLLNLATSITRVWLASKSSANPQHTFANDVDLQQSLMEVFPHLDIKTPSTNPLNLILPSFETIWRVILRGILEIGFASGSAYPSWKKAMIAFAQSPTKEYFELNPPTTRSSTNPTVKDDGAIPAFSPSANDLVQEALRLYVPTRRVHRAYQHAGGSLQLLAADIEGCHLSTDIWGSDAEVFRPDRWMDITRAQKKAFMPFGCSPLECPAKATFGPRMVGVVVGVILGVLEERGGIFWTVEGGDGNGWDGVKGGGRLDAGRMAYADLYLVRGQGS